MLLLWIICVIYVLCLSCFRVLWPRAGKGLTFWLSFVIFNCVFVNFPCGILDQLWYLIVSIPDLCHISCICFSKGVAILSFVLMWQVYCFFLCCKSEQLFHKLALGCNLNMFTVYDHTLLVDLFLNIDTSFFN